MAEQGGFDCEFVERPPEALQSDCPVCLLVLCDPYQATCCGYGFCKSCIDRLKFRNAPCPCCKAEEFQNFPDKRLMLSLYGYKVYCSFKTKGCAWQGELRQLQHHLNASPAQTDKRLEGCQYVELPCLHCCEPIQRMNLQVHESDQCPKRPFTCEYCKDFNSSYNEVTTNHWSECGYYPILCPMGCGQSIERKNFHSHIDSTCTYKRVECEFAKVGCTVKLPRKDMPAHLTEGLGQHMSLLLLNQTNLQAENERLKVRCVSLEEENQKRATEFTQLYADYRQLLSKQEATEHAKAGAMNKRFVTQVEFSSEIDILKRGIHTLQLAQAKNQTNKEQPFGMPMCHVYLTMNSFDSYKRNNQQWFSLPFYTHPYGYKMCLGVDANGWGHGTRRVYVAVYIFLMKGEFDNQLKWPFQGDITIELLPQDGGNNHTRVISITETTSNNTRVIRGTKAPSGPGITEFISHSELQPRYLRNGTLLFRISKVEFTS